MKAMLPGTGPFHQGELALQRATGERDVGASNGRIIADQIIPNAVGFIARQELAVVATIDADGQPWCSALVGPAGSFTVTDLSRLMLSRSAGRADDPMWANLYDDPRIGVLFLEVVSRRRYRVNGQTPDPDADPLAVDVGEAFGNCPKYISRRHLVVGPADNGAASAETGSRLGDIERRIIAAADMCFVASANTTGDLDASHRGGRTGFGQWRDEPEQLWIPDYRGNSMFNTLGNLAVHPAAGLLFIDFAGHQTLQLTGTTAIELDVNGDDAAHTGGTARAWTFTPTGWRRAPLPARVAAEFLDFSPHNP
jgi:predicted pyridoxine 5'-phosphate oxidase superfamily flavin-nucleotide-binding protein